MIVSFLGTKGGTGTTTMSVNVAADLRRVTGRSSLLVDLKPAPGDVALFLGLRPRHSILDFVDQLAWLDPLSTTRFIDEHACGVHVLGAGEEWGRPSRRDLEGVEQALDCLTALYDYVVLDVGSTVNATAVVALQASDVVVLVANPDVPCLRNLQRLIDAVKLTGVASERLRILLNRASEFGALSMREIEHVLGLTIDWSVSSDYRTVAAAVTSGVPVGTLRATDLQVEIEKMARALAGGPKEAHSARTFTTVAPSARPGASQ